MALEDEQDEALLLLLAALRKRKYAFVTPTPDTHRRVVRRFSKRRAQDLRDVFGWSRPFRPADLDPEIVELMRRGGVLAGGGRLARSTMRVSSLGEHLFLHSAFPTKARDAVFFGPDSYRFARFLEDVLRRAPVEGRIVDIGAGAGVGGVVAASLHPGARLVLADINPAALRLARINAAFAGVEAEVVLSDGLEGVEGEIDLAVANPPYLYGSSGRIYRDGGGELGAEVALAWTRAALARLSPGGRLLLYSGAPVVAGEDRLRAALAPLAAQAGCVFFYDEIDPDVFGGMLAHPAYRKVERIAAVGMVAIKRS